MSERVYPENNEVFDPYSIKPTPFFYQFNALLRRAATSQKRNYKTNCCQVALPLIVMIILLLLQLLVSSAVASGNQYGKYTPAFPHPSATPPIFYKTNQTYQNDASKCYVDADGKKRTSFVQMGDYVAPFLYLEGKANNATEAAMLRNYSLRIANARKSFLFQLQGTSLGVTLPYQGLVTEGGFIWPDRGNYLTACNLELFFGNPVVANVSNDRAAAAKNMYTNWFLKGHDTIGGVETVEASRTKGIQAKILHNSTLGQGADMPSILGIVGAAFSLLLAGDPYGNASSPTIMTSVYPYPTPKTLNDFDLISIVGPQLYMFVLHFMMPVIMSAVVYEKEMKLLEITKMMGLRTNVYWLVTYFFGYMLYFCVAMVMFILGLIFKFRYFTLNTRFGMFIFLFLWGHVLVAWSFFITVFFTKARTAAAVGYLYTIVAVFLTTQLLSPYFDSPDTSGGVLFAMSILPTTALWRGLSGFSRGVSFYQPGISLSQYNDKTIYIGDVLGYFVAQWFILMALFFYLDAVWVGGFGVKREKLFFLRKSYWMSKPPIRDDIQIAQSRDGEAEDVQEERRRVIRNNPQLALRTLDLHKEYPATGGNPKKIAVEQLALGMAPGECLGFLGPNGAGKSTTINTISGLITPTTGTCTVFGLDIRTDIDRVHNMLGVCAQDDILWESLTGREHLLFYGRLKGLRGAELEEAVASTLKSVNLHNEGSKWAGQYSGGMKRRLSVACALVGNPKVILLDEPSTGLDPASKSALWDVILKYKRKAAMLLTTHSLEEAEALCDRVAIFTDGELRTIGTSAELKARHGKGYRLTIHTDADNERNVENFVKNELFKSGGADLLNTLTGHMSFEIKKSAVDLSRVFSTMTPEALRRLKISEWAIQNTTLEEVFLRIEKRYRKSTTKISQDHGDTDSKTATERDETTEQHDGNHSFSYDSPSTSNVSETSPNSSGFEENLYYSTTDGESQTTDENSEDSSPEDSEETYD